MRDTEEIVKADQQDTSMEWDWVTMKWPTLHNTKSKQNSNVKNEASWKAAAAPHSAPCMSQSCKHKQMFEKRKDPEHLDGLMIKNFVMDWLTERKLHGEKILWGSRYGWRQPRRDQDGIGKFVSPIPTPERWKSLRSDWWATVHATLFFLLFFLAPVFPSFRCTESEDSSDFEFSDSNILCLIHSSVFSCFN